jgi:hypothetical protein
VQLKSNSIAVEPDKSQHDRPAVCEIAKHHPSTTFTSLHLLALNEEFSAGLKNFILFYIFKIECLKLP